MNKDAIRLLAFGLGYSARAAIDRMRPSLAALWGTTRDPAKRTEIEGIGATPLLFDATADLVADDAFALEKAIGEADHVLVSIAPDADGDPVLRRFRDRLADARPRAVCYLSTVGVYGDHGGDWVDETSECRPVSVRSRQRVTAETEWRRFSDETGVPVSLIRLAGIYGPGRGPFEKIRLGTARRIIKPDQVFNRIHRDDIAAIVEAALIKHADGAFNAADDEPAPPEAVLEHAASLLDVPPPPLVAFDEAEMTPMARSFYGENKRVRNDRIKRDLGVRLAHPTYRDGLLATLQAENSATTSAA